MFFSRPAGHKFVDRGDPAIADFDLTDFPEQDTWYDLDLSSIIPVGAKAVIIAVSVKCSVAGGTIFFRKKDNINVIEGNALEVLVADKYIRDNLVIACNNTRTIQGFVSNPSFTEINIVVTGWFI